MNAVSHRFLPVSALSLVLGCGTDMTSGGADTDGASSDSGMLSPETSMGEAEASSGADQSTSGGGTTSSAASSSSTGAEAVCGDGVVEADEDCDDGNEQGGDGCSSSCAVESEVPWLWLEPRQGSVTGLYLDAKGTLTAVGPWGDTYGCQDDDALVRQFSADGTLVFEDDPSVGANSILNAVELGPDGMFYAFGGTNSGGNGWVHTFGDGLGVDVIHTDSISYTKAEFGPNGWAGFGGASLIHESTKGMRSVLHQFGLRTIAYEQTGTLLSISNESNNGYIPASLVRFTETMEPLESIVLHGEYSAWRFNIATTGNGDILVEADLPEFDDIRQREVLRYDTDLALVWSTTLQGALFNSISEHNGQILLGGRRDDDLRAYATILDGSNGEPQWEGTFDATEQGYIDGEIFSALLGADGQVVVGGTLKTGEEDVFDNGHPFIAYLDADG